MSGLTASQSETLSLFASGADNLELAIRDLSETELDFSGTTGGWTIRQIVHHIADDGDAWSMNFKKALATPGAPIRFEGFPGNDAWAEALKRGRGRRVNGADANSPVAVAPGTP